jgi:hypothetical protein
MLPLALVLLGLSGCADADSKAEQAQKKLASWSSTLELADQELNDGSVTRVYAQQTAAEALKAIDEQKKDVLALPPEQPGRTDLELRMLEVTRRAERLSRRSGKPENRS